MILEGAFFAIKILGSLAVFIYGMHIMSQGIQKGAGVHLRLFLRRVTTRVWSAFGVGLFTTGLMQSSSAIMLIIISLVNAGLISAQQSVAIIIGANIGTTITAWLVALGGFVLQLSHISLPLLAVSMPFYFRGKRPSKYWAQFVIGFTVMFIGLDFLKELLPTLQHQALFQYFDDTVQEGVFRNGLFFSAGLLITMLLQSSSASMALTLTAVYNGWLSVEAGAYMILGQNLGTCITAELARIVSNQEAQIAARVHTVINLLGVIWMSILVIPFLYFIAQFASVIWGIDNALENPQYAILILAAFHTLFNICNGSIMLPLRKKLVQLAELTMKLEFWNTKESPLNPKIKVSEFSPLEIQILLVQQAKMAKEMVDRIEVMFNIKDPLLQKSHIQWSINQHQEIMRQGQQINTYVVQLANKGVSHHVSHEITTYIAIAQKLERMASQCKHIMYELSDRTTDQVWMEASQNNILRQGISKLQEASVIMLFNIQKGDSINIYKAEQIEQEIDHIRDQARGFSQIDPNNFDFNLKGILLFTKLVGIIENIGDGMIDVSRILAPINAYEASHSIDH